MAEHPILFNGDMVRAILSGRKTQTRRPCIIPRAGWAPWVKDDVIVLGKIMEEDSPRFNRFGVFIRQPFDAERNMYAYDVVPYPCGQPGDILWVRETFWAEHETDGGGENGPLIDCGPCLWTDGSRIDFCAHPNCFDEPQLTGNQTIKKHTREAVPGDWWLSPPEDWSGYPDDDYTDEGEWVFLPWSLYSKCPSIHMPRWASRIQLHVKSVRVERVQDITEADAIAEGMDIFEDGAGYTIPLGNGKLSSWMRHPEECFRALWDMTYTKRGYGWDVNPWAWVIEFERVDPQEVRHA